MASGLSDESTEGLTPLERAALKENEYEVWANHEAFPPSFLVALGVAGPKRFKIINPAAANAEVLSSNHYLDIVAYLGDQDFQRVKGRMIFLADDEDDDD